MSATLRVAKLIPSIGRFICQIYAAQQQKLSAADGLPLDAFGHSVAIDGNTALIGAVNDEIGSNGMLGSAYVFDRSGAAWTQGFKFVSPTGVTNNNFGASVAVSGNRFIMGAHGDDLGRSLSR